MFDRVHQPQRVSAFTLVFFMLPGFAAIAAETGDPPLMEAAKHRDQAAIRALVSEKADVNARSSDGSTALLWSAHWNNLETADLLLGAGADANTANDFRMTPLSEACTNANSALVRLLLKAGANPNTATATGETPLMTCARAGSADAVRMLVEYGAAIDTKEPTQNQTALMWAAAERHPDVVKALIEAHADLKAHTRQGFTAMHFAARVGDLESIKLLLAGVDINILTATEGGRNRITNQLGIAKTVGTIGYTPLLVAVVRGQVEPALFLLDHGADPNIAAAGFTPLHWASSKWESFTANPVYGFEDPMSGIPDRQSKLRLVRALLALGAYVNARMT